jgi:hypothetical protein
LLEIAGLIFNNYNQDIDHEFDADASGEFEAHSCIVRRTMWAWAIRAGVGGQGDHRARQDDASLGPRAMLADVTALQATTGHA